MTRKYLIFIPSLFVFATCNCQEEQSDDYNNFTEQVKKNDKSDIDLVLNQLGTKANLNETLKLKQVGKRVFVSDIEGPLLTSIMDEVSAFNFLYTRLLELEMELNEIRSMDAKHQERTTIGDMNANAKQASFEKIGDLKQDQNPKYIKIDSALSEQPMEWVYNNLMYLILGAIALTALALSFKTEG